VEKKEPMVKFNLKEKKNILIPYKISCWYRIATIGVTVGDEKNGFG
jgi:hypothetical protein